jgi:hypothetical protein
MEPEGSLLCSQETSTGPYSEPDQSNPHHPIRFLNITFLVIDMNVNNSMKYGPSAESVS